MTSPARRPVPAAIAEGWSVPIEMPHHDGTVTRSKRWKPVGWLSLNNLPDTVTKRIYHNKAKQAWLLAAVAALRRARIPRDLGRVYVEIEFRFTEDHQQEPSNYELTVKPIIDAFKPERSGIRYNPGKRRREPFVDHGYGLVPDDKQRYVVRGPELPIGPYLGRKNPIKGMVILHIKPLPPES